MLGIGMQELVIIFAIVMVIFGAKKLPQMGEGIGKGIRNFTRSLNEKEETHSPQEKPGG